MSHEHTPLPWNIGQSSGPFIHSPHGDVAYLYDFEFDEHGICRGVKMRPHGDADAELIVLAVNNHKSLVAACRAVSEAFKTLPHECQGGLECEKCKAVVACRAALERLEVPADCAADLLVQTMLAALESIGQMTVRTVPIDQTEPSEGGLTVVLFGDWEKIQAALAMAKSIA